MKKIFILIVAVALIWPIPDIFAEENEPKPTYKAFTKDGEESNRDAVKVEQTTVTIEKATFSLREMDYYIGMAELQLEAIIKQLKEMREMRLKIREEVDKVKLKAEERKGDSES